ncbi:hypothetical protein QJS10_CPA10g00846 [Acorus calamus]|uniref:Rx N-terminal domain-containing protein n=1 Tax=Acorus calamus TaxID=4465 RepID=A0AAV9DV43_ACOCL|nr:hypothetical protein QJS10_CPA10g00846 [Acorus calamus]
MAAMMVPTAVVCEIVERLAKLVENEVVMLWSVKSELRKLKINLSVRDKRCPSGCGAQRDPRNRCA